MNGNFGDDCDEIGYCGKWRDTKLSKYPPYSKAVPTKQAQKGAKGAKKGNTKEAKNGNRGKEGKGRGR